MGVASGLYVLMLHKLNKEACHECESIHDMHDIDEWGCPSCKLEDPSDENIDWDEQECANSIWREAND